MPFALVFAGLVLIAVGAQNTYYAFFQQLKSDAGPFTGYVVAIGGVGAMGYSSTLRELSHWLLALIVLSLILSNQGFFQKFNAALQAGPTTPAANPAPTSDTTAPTAQPQTLLTTHQQGLFGQTPSNAGQAKFNGWANYLFGLQWLNP